MYIKVPKAPRYTISNVDVDKNKLHRLSTKSDIFNYSKVETCIQWYIQQVKNLKYESYDENMLILIESLKLIRGIKYYDSEEYTICSFPRS